MKFLKPLLLLLIITPLLRAEVSETQLALAREAITAVQTDKMFDSIGPQLRQMAVQDAGLSDSLPPEKRAKAEELIGKIMDLSMNETKALVSKMDTIYAEVYSEAELRAIIAFFTSTEGRSMLSKQTEIMARIMPLAQEMQRRLLPQTQALIAAYKAETAPTEASTDE